MKVLFAVSNEEISESIIKKYQKTYKQIISYKNVYYFNAILKELQKDKTYDRIVISEDLEAFTHTQYDQIDKFIFEKLDSISDEASNVMGNDTPIILICSDRRTKSEQMLVKLFGIGVYNAIIGNDRSVDEVCRLINRHRTKKDAKIYYKIDSEEVNYQAENENDVSEMEIQNILAHYKRLGKNEERYVESFNNIAAQYNDAQLRIISKFLPLNVRAVLEEQSQKYQQIMSFNSKVSNELRVKKDKKDEGPSQILLKTNNRETIMSKPVVIPSSVNMNGVQKLSRPKKVVKQHMELGVENTKNTNIEKEIVEQPPEEQEVAEQLQEEQEIIEPVKRGRGRPRKNTAIESQETLTSPVKRGRGRPKKNQVAEIETEEMNEETDILPGFENDEASTLPGFENEDTSILPGFENDDEYNETNIKQQPVQSTQEVEDIYNSINNYSNISSNNNSYNNYSNEYEEFNKNEEYDDNYESSIDLSSLLTPNKKIITFLGTSKNGTSFIVNNLAELMSSMGVNTAILDTTKNRNSYYIYTKNEEQLRETAAVSI